MYGKDYLEKICNDWADANEKSLETFGCGDSAYENLYNGIPKIKAQTLIMYGDKDPMIGIEHAKYYHQHIRNSLLVIELIILASRLNDTSFIIFLLIDSIFGQEPSTIYILDTRKNSYKLWNIF